MNEFDLGDIVRIIQTELTQELGFANNKGEVYGCTIPDSSGVSPVIGNLPPNGKAVNVFFEDRNEQFWFAIDLIEMVEIGSGTEIHIANEKFRRNESGTWTKIEEDK